MPIGTSDGEVFKDSTDFTLSQIPEVSGYHLSQGSDDVKTGDVSYKNYDKPFTPPKSFMDKLKETWPARAIQGLADAFSLPHDVYQGKVDLNSPEGFSRVQNMALNLGVGGLATADLKPGVGMFGGRYSKEAIQTAKKMESQGFSNTTIKEMTGLERGSEGIWKREFSDASASINKDLLKSGANEGGQSTQTTKLGDLLNHDKLYEAYPEAKDINVIQHEGDIPDFDKATGVYLAEHGPEKKPAILLSGETPANEVLPTLLHETQHYIQDIEGFAAGSPKHLPEGIITAVKDEMFLGKQRESTKAVQNLVNAYKKTGDKKYYDAAHELSQHMNKIADYELYRRLSNEVEARNVETRMHMSEAALKNLPASTTEDVPRGSQIIPDLSDVYLGSPYKREALSP